MRKPGLEFGPYRLDPEAHVLLREGAPVALPPKAFETLLALVEARGQLVEKTELMRRVWPEAVVDESNLSQQVFILRKALGDGPDGQPSIHTVPRRGYRLAAEVREAHSHEGPSAARSEPAPPPAAPARWRRAAGLAAAVLLLGTGIAVWQSGTGPAAAATLAVLPLANGSGEADSEYLADGLTEGLIQELGSVPALRVLGRSTAFRYKASRVEPREAGRALGADAVLSGRVLHRGAAVDVEASLVSVADGRELWVQSYSVDVGGLPKLQRAIRDEVARTLARVATSPADRRARAVDEEAYRSCLQGRFFWNKRTGEGLRRSIELFRQALRRDPGHAEAWSGLADAYGVLPEYTETTEAEAYPAAAHAAIQALLLDPNLAEAHASLAFVLFWWGRDAQRSEQEFRRALELNPGYATARHWYGNVLLSLGRVDEALAQLEEAHRADPLSLIIGAERGSVLYHARRFDEARDLLQRTLEMDPSFREARFWLARTLLARGDLDAALAECRAARELYPGPASMLAEMGVALERAGRREEAREHLRRLESLSAGHPVAYELAILHAGMGNREKALAFLEAAALERASDLSFVSADPLFETLRDDPRFQDLQARLRRPRAPTPAS